MDRFTGEAVVSERAARNHKPVLIDIAAHRPDTDAPLTNVRYVPWGIDEFDRRHGGLVGQAFNLLAAPNHDAGMVAVGHFLAAGLDRQSRVCLVAFDNPDPVLAKLSYYGFEFADAIVSERFVYLYYKSTFVPALSCATDYLSVLGEIRALAGPIERLAFFNADMLFNLQSEYLARASAAKFAAAGVMPTALGYYSRPDKAAHTLLDAVCASAMPSHLELHANSHNNSHQQYVLTCRKGPFARAASPCLLELKPGQGYAKR
jgi:hypothetical protein